MNVLAIIQARLGSTRLPGKVALPLGRGRVIDLCANRVARAMWPGGDIRIAVPRHDMDKLRCASDSLSGEPSPFIGGWYGFPYDGDENDVLGRYIACATSVKPWPDIVVRITADCPLVLPEAIQYAVGQVATSRFASIGDRPIGQRDYFGYRFLSVRGWDVEAFTMGELLLSSLDDEREHVTTGMRERWQPGEWPDDGPCNLTLDTQEDYERLTAIVNQLKDPVTALADEILKAAEAVRATV